MVPGLVESLDALRIAITLFDAREKLTYANQHFNHLFRSMPARQRLIGLSYEDIVKLEYGGGELAEIADFPAFLAERRAQLIEGDFRPRDIHLADGRVVELKARRNALGGWIVLWTDVTQARQLLTRLDSAIEMSADAYAFFDREGKLALCNRGFAQLHGTADVASLARKKSDDILREAAKRGLFKIDGPVENWIARRREAQSAAAGAMTVIAANGKAYLVRDRAMRDGRITVFTDTTDRNRAEASLAEQSEALKQTREKLDRNENYLADLVERLDRAKHEADETKKRFLRTMSHELKTPLNAIIGFSDLIGQMAGRLSPDQVKEYSVLIHQGGRNLLMLINQILDLTKIAAGKYELRRVKVDAAQALARAGAAYAREAAEKSVTIDTGGAAGLFVDADTDVLDGMLNHLVTNAVQFTQAGGHVRLSAQREADRVMMSVADNGPGVNEEDLARILLPFEQIGGGTSEHSSGAGLGLTLVKAFAELHNGELTVKSRPGAGFTATLALHAAPND